MSNQRRQLLRVAAQILNRPVLISEEWAAIIISAVRSELNIDVLTTTEGIHLNGAGMDFMAADARRAVDAKRRRHAEQAAARAGRTVAPMREEESSSKIFPEYGGVAVIEISGTLTKNWGLQPYSGFTGYDGIKAQFIAAMEDDSVDAILLDIESPGGAVAGCFDLVDLMYAYRQDNRKPVVAIANEMACSGAFAIMTVAEPGWRFVPRTGEVGSVGVLLIHTDEQKAMQMEGVGVRIFRAGKWKAEGNPYEDMDPKTAERIQTTIDEMRDLFIDTVARNIAAEPADVAALKKTIRETEALTYIGRHARAAGLVEEVASEDQVWDRLMERLGR